VYTYLFEISPEAFGVMLTLLEKLSSFMYSVICFGFLYCFVKGFLEKIGRLVSFGYCCFALTMLFVYGVNFV